MKTRLVVLLVEALMEGMSITKVKTVDYDLYPGIWSRRVTLGYKLDGIPDYLFHAKKKILRGVDQTILLLTP